MIVRPVPYLAPIFCALFTGCWLKSIDFGEPLISRAFTTAMFSPKTCFFSPFKMFHWSFRLCLSGSVVVVCLLYVEMIIFIKLNFIVNLSANVFNCTIAWKGMMILCLSLFLYFRVSVYQHTVRILISWVLRSQESGHRVILVWRNRL